MAEFKVEDYFAGSGGAADDSTDCTAAFQAALDAVHTAGKVGTILFPSGVCRMTGSVAKNFAHSGSKQGRISVKGTGDSAIRLMGTGSTRIDIEGAELLTWEMILLGDMSGDPETPVKETNASHLHLGGDVVVYEKSQIYGLGVSGSSGAMVYLTNRHTRKRGARL